MVVVVAKDRKQTLDVTCNVQNEEHNFEYFSKQGEFSRVSCPLHIVIYTTNHSYYMHLDATLHILLNIIL